MNQPDDLDYLLEHEIEVWLVGEAFGRIAMHQKIFQADSMLVSGSANWTEASAGNHEFCSLIEAHEPTLASMRDMTSRLLGNSTPYARWHGAQGRVNRQRARRTFDRTTRLGPTPNAEDDADHAARFSLSLARRAESVAALQRRTDP